MKSSHFLFPAKAIPLTVFALVTAVAGAGEFESNGCFIRWDESSLTVGNGRFERVYRATASGLRTMSLKVSDGGEFWRPDFNSSVSAT